MGVVVSLDSVSQPACNTEEREKLGQATLHAERCGTPRVHCCWQSPDGPGFASQVELQVKERSPELPTHRNPLSLRCQKKLALSKGRSHKSKCLTLAIALAWRELALLLALAPQGYFRGPGGQGTGKESDPMQHALAHKGLLETVE